MKDHSKVMNYAQFKSAADSANKGYTKAGNIKQKDAAKKSTDSNLQTVKGGGSKVASKASEKASTSSLHKGFSGDTNAIKKFTSAHLKAIGKKSASV